MKYAQLLIGLLAGTALGGSVVASTGVGASNAKMDPEAIKTIVRDVISQEPKLILDSVQKYQIDQQKKEQEGANEVLKDPSVRDQVFNDQNAAYIGPKDAKRTVVQFFDYDCPACKMMYKSIEEVVAKDKGVKIVFREYPIFGPVSDNNSKIGLAVWRLNPDKYYDFYKKMMDIPGHQASEAKTLAVLKDLGLNADKIKAEAAKKEVADEVTANHTLGEKLKIRGTPTLVIGDEIVPHALSPEDLAARLSALGGEKPADSAEKKPETPGN